MLYELCRECRNWFTADSEKHIGKFHIKNGEISPQIDLENGQYFRIVGSIFNDGVWRYPSEQLIDEDFDGAVWAMRVPPSFIALSAKIDEWNNKYAESANSPFVSESFGGYSYTKGTNTNGTNWQKTFANELNRWRKV